MWAILTKDCFPAGEYDKLSQRKVGPFQIVRKISNNAYKLKLPKHMKTSEVFNVKHLVKYTDDLNSRTSSFDPRENDADQGASTQPLRCVDTTNNVDQGVSTQPPGCVDTTRT